MAELITFRCTKCEHVLKIGAEKAGRKAKCPKCGEGLTIPGGKETAQQKYDRELEDAKGTYGFLDEPVATPKVDVTAPIRPGDDDDDDEKPKGPPAQQRDRAVKHRTLLEPERW